MHQSSAASFVTASSPPRSLMGAIRHLARVRRKFGIAAVFQLLVDRLARHLIYLQVDNLVCFDVDRLVEPPPIDSELTFRFLTPVEIRAFAADPVNQIEQPMAERAGVGQDLCFGVLAGDRLAGYGWCSFGRIDPQHCGDLAMWCPPHVAYMYKGFTHPEFRGKRLNGLRVLLAAKQLAPRGIRQLVALVDWTNWSSMHSCLDAGSTFLGRLITIGVGRVRWSFFPKAAEEIGFQFGRQAAFRGQHREVSPNTSLASFAESTNV